MRHLSPPHSFEDAHDTGSFRIFLRFFKPLQDTSRFLEHFLHVFDFSKFNQIWLKTNFKSFLYLLIQDYTGLYGDFFQSLSGWYKTF